MPNKNDSLAKLRGARSIEELLDSGALPEAMPLMTRLWPICRSVTGPGVRESLDILSELLPLERYSTPSGTQVFDWTVPPEWRIRDAYVLDEAGKRVIDFQKHNLHVVQYSEPVSVELALEELQEKLHSIPAQPDAVPYVTSYYRRDWGFCINQRERQLLKSGRYRCVIDSELDPNGRLDFAQHRLNGQTESQIFFSTYVCHPSMANNELSGPVVQILLFKLLSHISDRRLTYRAAFTTETIGTLCFLDRFGAEIKKSVVGGSVVTCVGNDGPFTYVRSCRGNTVSDQMFEHVLAHANHECKIDIRDFSPIGSDERQYCSPGFNFPTGSFSRSRFEDFPEYHTSLDDLDYVSEHGLQQSLRLLLRFCQSFEMNLYPIRTNPYGEPQLGKRGLYSASRTWPSNDTIDNIFILAYADGEHSMLDIARKAGKPIWELLDALERLVVVNLVELADERMCIGRA